MKKFNKKEYNKVYRLANREKYREYQRQYRLDNKEKIKKTQRQNYLKNKERIKERNRKYKLNHKDKIKEQQKQYRSDNRKTITKYKREYRFKKYHSNAAFRLVNIQRARIRKALKGVVKSKRTLALLGCSAEEIWKHLESKFKPGMTKENYGEWHVDHIKPCASFDLTDPEQQAICFHYTNLQPLWAVDNIKKRDRLDYEME